MNTYEKRHVYRTICKYGANTHEVIKYIRIKILLTQDIPAHFLKRHLSIQDLRTCFVRHLS